MVKNWKRVFAVATLCFVVIAVVTASESMRNEPLQPLPPVLNLDQKKLELGERLFTDTILSSESTLSCASCHDLKTNGADGKPAFIGINGQRGNIRTPTVYNSRYNFAYFWDGRVSDFTGQIEDCISNRLSPDVDWEKLVAKLRAAPVFSTAFASLYEDGVTRANIADALSVFESSLVTSGSSFDRWLLGSSDALTEEELAGYRLFKSYGCVSCHQGRNVGGNMFGKMGVVHNYFRDRKATITYADLGRQNVTNDKEDRFLFKVPSLRLVSLNRYFFHDASADNLEDAIRTMAYYQLGRDMPDGDVNNIAAFLKTLRGKHPRMQK